MGVREQWFGVFWWAHSVGETMIHILLGNVGISYLKERHVTSLYNEWLCDMPKAFKNYLI